VKEKIPSLARHKHSYSLDSYQEDPADPRFVFETFRCDSPGCPNPVTTRRVRK
jgi:hypothetical protein